MKLNNLLKLSGKKLTTALDASVRNILHARYPHPTCFVCGRKTEWFHPKDNPQGCQVGHYISRSVHILRWDFLNVEPQCAPCNRYHENNTLPFMSKLIETHGVERLKYLDTKWKDYVASGGKMSTGQKRAILFELQHALGELTTSTQSATMSK